MYAIRSYYGIISDRNGKPLAMNKLGFSINIKPHLRSTKRIPLLKKLINLINDHFPEYSKEELFDVITSYSIHYTKLYE